MQSIVKESLTRNGNGSNAVNARGISKRGWTPEQRVAAAADAVLGASRVVPTIRQAATAFYVSPAAITAELRARAAVQGVPERQDTASDIEVSVEAAAASNTPSRPSYDELSPIARCIVGVLNPAPYDDRIAAFHYLGASMLWNAVSALESRACSTE
jgi:hypothetical protein